MTAEGGGAATPRRVWLTRNLKVVSVVSLLQDTASELLYPIMPIFLTSVLGAPAAVVGVVEGIADGAAALTKAVAGRLSDRYRRRRPLIGLGYALAALGKLLVGVALVWPMVLAGRCLDRFGKGIRGAPRDALIAADAPAEARGRAFGFHRSMDTVGAVIGPALGLAAYHLMGGHIRPLLLLAVVPAFASAALVLALHEPPPAPVPAPVAAPTPTGRLPRAYWRAVALLTAFSLINFPDAMLLLRLHEIGFTLPAVIGAYIAYNAVYAAMAYPAGALADRMRPPTIIAIGLLVFATAYIGLGLTTSATAAWALVTAYGAFTALTDGVGKAWIAGLLPADAQGRGQGTFQACTGLGVLVAGVWAGLAWGEEGTVPLLLSGITAAIIGAGLLLAPRHRGRALAAR